VTPNQRIAQALRLYDAFLAGDELESWQPESRISQQPGIASFQAFQFISVSLLKLHMHTNFPLAQDSFF